MLASLEWREMGDPDSQIPGRRLMGAKKRGSEGAGVWEPGLLTAL